MADQSVRGRFVWHELVTPDSNAAHAFYGKAIGWKSQPWEEDASYVMFAAPRGPIGATVAGNGSTPYWLPYVGTGDLDATIELATQKGGSVVKEVATLSSGSRYAVLQDPYGAKFGVYESADDYGKITPPQPGEHSWHELVSSDHDGAFDFYSALFGWEKLVEHDMGEMGTYLIYGFGDVPFGGMMTMQGQSPAWVSYVQVKDVNQTAKKVKSAGGTIINGPMEVPGGDWIVQAVDPQGAMFAAHALAADMKKAAESKSAKPKKARQAKPAEDRPEQLSLAESPPPVVQDPETPADQEAPPSAPVEEPARKAPAKKAPARKKAPAKEAPPASESPSEEAPAKRAPAKKAPAKKAPAKKGPAKKAPGKKSSKKSKAPAKKSGGKSAGKKSGAKKSGSKKSSKKRPAAKGAGSKQTAASKGARKGARKTAKVTSKTRSGGKKKAAKKPRKGK